jgi:hypothetical protein
MPAIRVIPMDDVHNDEDLIAYFRYFIKLIAAMAREFASAAAVLSAMLRAYDEKAGKRGRRRKVVRPLALAAGVMVLVSKYLALSARRFQVEYAEEIAAAKRPRRQSSRSFRFGDGRDAA